MKIASVAEVKAHFSTFLNNSKKGPIVVTKNGRPAAILISVEDEAELERLTMAYSPKLQKILSLARQQIKDHGGISHEDFWGETENKKTENDVSLLISFIHSLKDFKFIPPDIPYNNMGATIADAVLQAGLKWTTVVKPRVDKLRNQPTARTTAGFNHLIEREGINKVLNWGKGDKPARVLSVIDLFRREGVETESDLNIWLRSDANIEKLKNINGIKDKTADYFKILVGIPTTAIDRNLIKFLLMADINIKINEYARAHTIISTAAEKMNISKTILDHSIWKYISDKPQHRRQAS